jgi:hypothetical protein
LECAERDINTDEAGLGHRRALRISLPFVAHIGYNIARAVAVVEAQPLDIVSRRLPS